jgi:hypothetical protein
MCVSQMKAAVFLKSNIPNESGTQLYHFSTLSPFRQFSPSSIYKVDGLLAINSTEIKIIKIV